MKKKVLAILLVMLFAVQLMPFAFAAPAQPSDDVQVDAGIQAKMSNNTAAWKTNNPGTVTSLTLPQSTANSDVDFRVDRVTATIIDSIEDWYQYGEEMIFAVTGEDDPDWYEEDLRDTLTGYFNVLDVSGTFTVEITSTQALGVPDAVKNGDNMEGFNEAAKQIFEEVDRTYANNKLTIEIAIKSGITMQDLYDHRTQYLGVLNFTAEDIDAGDVTGTCQVKGKMEGDVSFALSKNSGGAATVHFETDEVTTNLIRTTGGSDIEYYKITFNVDGDTNSVAPIYVRGNVKASELPKPTKVGFTFDGWYTDAERTNKVTNQIHVNKNMILYGHWVSQTLETEEHFAYVIGYPDDTVRPENYITREEVAMMFYRLLKDDAREKIRVTDNNFTDIASVRWSNTAISTMANGGYIVGRGDGTFDPEANITRAEFATLVTRFANLVDTSGATFKDIQGHWAENYIKKAATAGWINGDPDGNFRPNDPIKRAEAMALVNRVLSRSVNEAGLHADTRIWKDIKVKDWYYYVVLEATNSHTYTRQADGLNEKWGKIIPNKIWD